MDKQNNKTIEKNGLVLSEDGKIVVGVVDTFITEVIIPEGIEAIGDYAFKGCRQLNTVNLPYSLKKIGFGAFVGTHLKEIAIPEGVEEIEEAAFYDSGLSVVSLPSTLKILEEAFLGCRISSMYISVRNLESLKIYGQKESFLSNERMPWGNFTRPNWTKIYVPSDMVDTYKKHPVFGRFEHIEDITQPDE